MMMADADFLNFSGMEAEIAALIRDLDRAKNAVNSAAGQAAEEAARIIADEQKRLLGKAQFKRRTTDLRGLITIKRDTKSKVYKLRIGYDTEAIRAHPEVLLIEFGRPGKSARRMKPTDSKGRKKGDFPPHVSHVRAGFFLAKDKATDHFNNRLMDIAAEKFRGG